MTAEGHGYRMVLILDLDRYRAAFGERSAMKAENLIRSQDDAPYPLRYTYGP
jgi:hypothetical protein